MSESNPLLRLRPCGCCHDPGACGELAPGECCTCGTNRQDDKEDEGDPFFGRTLDELCCQSCGSSACCAVAERARIAADLLDKAEKILRIDSGNIGGLTLRAAAIGLRGEGA